MKKEIRVTFDMPDELHRDLTIHLASIRNTKKNFITDLIKEKLKLEQSLNEGNKTNNTGYPFDRFDDLDDLVETYLQLKVKRKN